MAENPEINQTNRLYQIRVNNHNICRGERPFAPTRDTNFTVGNQSDLILTQKIAEICCNLEID
jgi:hypothetical protein